MRTIQTENAALTRDELQFLVENPDEYNFTEITDFFAKGGFNKYSDEQINEMYNLKHGEGA